MAKTEISKPGEASPSRPLDVFSTMRNEMNRMFERFERDWPRLPSLFGGGNGGALVPELDVHESASAITVEADLPGVEEKDLEVTLTGNRLTISGKREAERNEDGTTWYTYERSYGSFSRTFTLPEGVDTDRVDGELKNGVLTVHLPKRAELKPRKISIKGIIEKVKSLGSGDKAKV